MKLPPRVSLSLSESVSGGNAGVGRRPDSIRPPGLAIKALGTRRSTTHSLRRRSENKGSVRLCSAPRNPPVLEMRARLMSPAPSS